MKQSLCDRSQFKLQFSGFNKSIALTLYDSQPFVHMVPHFQKLKSIMNSGIHWLEMIFIQVLISYFKNFELLKIYQLSRDYKSGRIS